VPMDVERFIDYVKTAPYYRGQIVTVVDIAAQDAQYGELRPPVPQKLQAALAEAGIRRLYTHQVTAVEAVRRGENVVVVTGTASGKTLCYNIPVLEGLLQDPQLRALYLFPTKALAQDQLRGLSRYTAHIPFKTGTYDGDTPRNLRRTLRDEANVILTNPDMLHAGILPNHSRWAHFLGRLRYVVIDEIHVYRGIFGSNVANVIRRLRRICRHYGADPLFICCSATIGNPKEHAEAVVGQEVTLVDNDGSPRGPKKFVVWNPPFVDETKVARRSPTADATNIMSDLIARFNVQTISFVQARTSAELLYRYVQEELATRSHRLAEAVSPYRGGYLPEERRAIERRLFNGELMGVTTTNALELGIDIGSLDAALLVGYPGSIASTWQQAGRAGRGSEEALVTLIARGVPIDQYLAHHPEYFFGQSPEKAIIDPDNPFVLYRHIRCALQELPVTGADVKLFGEHTGGIIQILADIGEAVERGGRWYWNGRRAPALDVNLRNADDNNYLIQDMGQDNRVIGMIDEWGAYTQLHPQAIYIQNGETYFVEELDLQARIAYVRKGVFDYYTRSVDRTTIRMLDVADDPAIEKQWRNNVVGFGPVEVTSIIYMFRKIKFHEADSIGFGTLDLPPVELDTMAMWLAPSVQVRQRVRSFHRDPAEGLLGIANAVVGVLPLWVMCDPGDVGSVVDSSNLGVPAMFIYDGYPGGLGFARKTYDLIEEILTAALAVIEECSCENGCPSCVGAVLPYLYSQREDIDTRGKIPDKEAAICMLHDMLQLEPYEPKLPEGYAAQQAQAAEETAAAMSQRPAPVPLQAPRTTPLQLKPLPEHIERRIRQQIEEHSRRHTRAY